MSAQAVKGTEREEALAQRRNLNIKLSKEEEEAYMVNKIGKWGIWCCTFLGCGRGGRIKCHCVCHASHEKYGNSSLSMEKRKESSLKHMAENGMRKGMRKVCQWQHAWPRPFKQADIY